MISCRGQSAYPPQSRGLRVAALQIAEKGTLCLCVPNFAFKIPT